MHSPEQRGSTLNCDICHTVIEVADSLISKSNASIAELELAVTKFCVDFNIYDQRVCTGVIDSFGPTIWPILIEIGFDPQKVCMFLGFCTSNNSDEEQQQKTTRLTFPPKPKKTLPNNKLDATDFYILHVTDIHYDPNYTVGANANCKQERVLSDCIWI